jgi:hypothetical protein
MTDADKQLGRRIIRVEDESRFAILAEFHVSTKCDRFRSGCLILHALE